MISVLGCVWGVCVSVCVHECECDAWKKNKNLEIWNGMKKKNVFALDISHFLSFVIIFVWFRIALKNIERNVCTHYTLGTHSSLNETDRTIQFKFARYGCGCCCGCFCIFWIELNWIVGVLLTQHEPYKTPSTRQDIYGKFSF